MFPGTFLIATFGQVILTFFIVLVSLLLMGLILLQKNRGSGLSGAFGGVGGHTAFGTKTGDFLTWVTVGLAGVFIILSITAVFVFERAVTPATAAPAAPPPASTDAPLTTGGAAPNTAATPIDVQSTRSSAPLVNQPPRNSAETTPATGSSGAAQPATPPGNAQPPAQSTPPAGESKPD
ncbi:MAG: hypothetical protein HBSAPP02_26390 [Phycisphaerae bacterium]|nr:MAG: preprotein translocase subunit SecG [Planctomycetia bacterium]RIK68194.1 MAG: preprotein translocase subunit SecG [Planctomycetota bacterium]GJQ27607.1 MAG: hypothetical protein HBSAPP02_26390 [Phycisphaerae bacterium]